MWQSRLVASLLQQDTPQQEVHKSISGSLEPARLLQIYRNNYFSNMQEALQATFKQTKIMLGSDYFHHISHQFILNEPFQEASLLHFGAAFADNIAASDAMVNLKYVADLAALEWAMEVVYNTHQPRLDTGKTWRINPALQIVASDYALFDIWQYSRQQDGQQITQAAFDVSHQAQWVLVSWVDGDIYLQSFNVEQGSLLRAILAASLQEQQLTLSQLPATTSQWLVTIGVLA